MLCHKPATYAFVRHCKSVCAFSMTHHEFFVTDAYCILQRYAVIVTTVRVTISFSDSFFVPIKDLLVLKIFRYSDSRLK